MKMQKKWGKIGGFEGKWTVFEHFWSKNTEFGCRVGKSLITLVPMVLAAIPVNHIEPTKNNTLNISPIVIFKSDTKLL